MSKKLTCADCIHGNFSELPFHCKLLHKHPYINADMDVCEDYVEKIITTNVGFFGGDDKKFDGGKIPAHLIEDFFPAINALLEVATFGAEKYEAHSWLTVDNAQERYHAAFWRHILKGEGIDPDSGLPHQYHALWNLMAMITLKSKKEE